MKKSCNKLRVEIGVRTDVTKGAVSTRVKLMTEIEESPCGVIDYGMVSHLTLDLKSMSLIPTNKASTEHPSQ